MSPEKQCLKNKEKLKVYLEREELEIIDDLKKDTPIVAVNPNPDPPTLNQLDIAYAFLLFMCFFEYYF